MLQTKSLAKSFAFAIAALICGCMLQIAFAQPASDSKSPADTGATAAPAAPSTGAAAKPSRIVANVNGIAIFRSDIERDLAAASKGRKLTPEQTAQIQASLLEQQIDRAALQDFLASQKVTASKDEIDAAMAQIAKRLASQKSSLEKVIESTGAPESVFRMEIGRQLAWNKFANNQMTDKELEGFFKQYHDRFDGTQRRVSHILLRPESGTDEAAIKALVDDANKLRDDINAGKITFEAAVERYSGGPSRREKGDLGFIPPQGVMVPQFSEAAFTLQPGEISKPVVTPFGVHLIKVTDTKAGKKTWRDVAGDLRPIYAQLLMKQIIEKQREALKDKIDYADDFPHFKPGTQELATPESATPASTTSSGGSP